MLTRQLVFFGFVVLALWRSMSLILQPAPAPVLPDLLAQQNGQDSPEVWLWGEIVSLTRHGPYSTRFAFEIHGVLSFDPEPPSLHDAPQRHPIEGKPRVWLSWPTRKYGLDGLLHQPIAGDVWLLPVRWRPTEALQREGDFDTWRWMQQQQLVGLGQVHTTASANATHRLAPQRLGQGRSFMQSWRQHIREQIFSAIADRRRAGLVAALSMGDQNAIDLGDWEIFRRTGVAHLVSISGLHVTLLAVWLATAVDFLWRRLRWRHRALAIFLPAPCVAQWVALLGALVYAWFSGWGLPAQRTVWMLLATSGLRMSGWDLPPHTVWLGLVAIVAALDPLALAQPGFWLSYVAVAVLYATQKQTSSDPLRRWLHETVALQMRISVALAPLSLLFFQSISVAGLWVNLWAIPWVTFILTPLSLVGMIWPTLWQPADWATGWLLWGLESAAHSSWALIEVDKPPAWTIVPATFFAILAFSPGPWLLRCWWASLVCPLLLWRTVSGT